MVGKHYLAGLWKSRPSFTKDPELRAGPEATPSFSGYAQLEDPVTPIQECTSPSVGGAWCRILRQRAKPKL